MVDNQESKCTHLVVKNHEECDYNAALESLGLTPDYVLDEDVSNGFFVLFYSFHLFDSGLMA